MQRRFPAANDSSILAPMLVVLDSLDLSNAERKLVIEALGVSGSIAEAATLLGITRHALKRRMLKHQIAWPIANNGGHIHASIQDGRNEMVTRLAMLEHHPVMPPNLNHHNPNLPPPSANLQPMGYGPQPLPLLSHPQGPLAHPGSPGVSNQHPGPQPISTQPMAKINAGAYAVPRPMPPTSKRGH